MPYELTEPALCLQKFASVELDVHLVCDNLATHKTPAVNDWLAKHPGLHLHFTPTGSSWINQVERFFAYLTCDLLQRSDHRNVQTLEADISNFGQRMERKPRTVHLDQDRRADPRITRPTSSTNFQRGTLAAIGWLHSAS
jgi:transposase